ncbi:phosphatase PAP2 family protein [Curvibacter sp. CHRR-16]|uniref:phosphatase PAP2 family protein n=1 Tax=Curvibacter sp. CHRR-16 TaxID=2835872 RepID=UPI001BDA0698|nr:phosphatase PAP2 family protein [Curvibacter sp. CHRR-16]MBT0570501.1 phosphatase PAP2 family protein [Curvibacter sp. CHRR-16]
MDALDDLSWWTITYWGTSGLLLPASALLLWGWWFGAARSAVAHFVPALLACSALTLASKIAFLGWGWGIRAIDFTGFSGHSMLAAAVLPLLTHSLPWPAALYRWPRGSRYLPALLGGMLSMLVAFSRVELRAHTPSEALAGWLLGLLVSGFTLRTLYRLPPAPLRHPALLLAPLVLLGSLHSPAATYVPTRKLEVRIALLLSGRDKPHTRAEWKAQSKPSPRL